jgi:uroporphyrinogen decarboxylase
LGLTHRERVIRAIERRELDRVPADLGGTYATSISLRAYENLVGHLKLRGKANVIRKWAKVVQPDEKVLRYFDIDTRMIVPRCDDEWNEWWRLKRLPDGSFLDEWGIIWGKPDTGNYFIKKSPLAGDVDIKDLETHPWPNPDDPERYYGIKEQARTLKEGTDYAVIMMFPRPIVSLSQFLRGYEDWFLDMAANRDFLEALMDKILNIDLKIGERVFDAIGKYVDLVFVHDDLATQESLMFSPEHYREIVKPRHQKIFNFIKTHSDAKVIYHCDGAIYPLINDFIEIGVDALNPVQVSAEGMNTRVLKSEFGDRLSFWGGIDTHQVLPQGSPEDVREEVKKQIEILGKGGGYILAAVHNIQDDVKAENIVAMFEATKEFGKYD